MSNFSVLLDAKRPVKVWIPDADLVLDEKTKQQALAVADLPFVFKHVALMPDTHQGFGVPIGCVFASQHYVVPNAVGVDIGCGILAACLNLYKDQVFDRLDLIRTGISELVPVGFDTHAEPQRFDDFDEDYFVYFDSSVFSELRRELDLASYQIGTLGGGNHFIELQVDELDRVWVMIHSGSRHFGYWIASYFNRRAKEFNELWFSDVSGSDLNFLPLNIYTGKSYRFMHDVAMRFAQRNRAVMLDAVISVLMDVIDREVLVDVQFDVPHNYMRFENHFGRNVLVHRKGAICAREDLIGVIPGSMGSKSYVVRGLGNFESFTSASHGAGRILGRRQAKRELSLEEQQALLREIGSVTELTVSQLDEAPSAYKNIDDVMRNQADLVSIVHELRPLLTIKG